MNSYLHQLDLLHAFSALKLYKRVGKFIAPFAR